MTWPYFQIGMELLITEVLAQDFGVYRCTAKNPRSETDGVITISGMFWEHVLLNWSKFDGDLFIAEIIPRTRRPPDTTTTTTKPTKRTDDYKKGMICPEGWGRF